MTKNNNRIMSKTSFSEEIKKIRTNLKFASINGDLKVVCVTSSLPGEGKSRISANLAASFSQNGEKVLLIDCDLRLGRAHKIFEISNKKGLSNLILKLDDDTAYEEYIQKTDVKNLFVIPRGMVPPNPSELLVSPKMHGMVEILRNSFDIIIFDAPPCLIVADALIVTRLVDFSIIVTAQNVTKIDDLKRAKLAIENVGGKIAGVVLNKVQVNAKSYENSYYYGESNSSSKK